MLAKHETDLFQVLCHAVVNGRLMLIEGKDAHGNRRAILAIKSVHDHRGVGVAPIGNLVWAHPNEIYEIIDNQLTDCCEMQVKGEPIPEDAEVLGEVVIHN